MSTALKRTYTPEQYLALERKAEFKSEYYDGQIHAMAGTSFRHNRIAGNLYREISLQFRGRPCEVYISDVRVCVDRSEMYTYPDVVAICGEPRLFDQKFDTLLNPSVLIEVLSPSTEAHDRGRKFAHYRRLESLREYVLIDQDNVQVERYSRQGEDWPLTRLDELGQALRLDSIDCEVDLRAIYEKVRIDDRGFPDL